MSINCIELYTNYSTSIVIYVILRTVFNMYNRRLLKFMAKFQTDLPVLFTS